MSKQESLDASRVVIVRVWKAYVAGKATSTLGWALAKTLNPKREDIHVGHVSVETIKWYASHWPDPDWKKGENGSTAEVAPARVGQRLRDDKKGEGKRWPDVTAYFYSLNQDAIDGAIEAVQSAGSRWGLLGELRVKGIASAVKLSSGLSKTSSVASASFWKRLGNSVQVKKEDPNEAKVEVKGQYSCASLALMLLIAGGIADLNPRFVTLMQQAIITPNAFATFIEEMKRCELIDHPQTAKFPHAEILRAPPPRVRVIENAGGGGGSKPDAIEVGGNTDQRDKKCTIL
jgi:hypothetical protein